MYFSFVGCMCRSKTWLNTFADGSFRPYPMVLNKEKYRYFLFKIAIDSRVSASSVGIDVRGPQDSPHFTAVECASAGEARVVRLTDIQC